MRNNETGEFELVVGNGQLLSGFFIVILLCAVMFAMGFVVARAKYQQDAVNNSAATSAGSLRPPSSGVMQTATPPASPVDTSAPPQTAAGSPGDPSAQAQSQAAATPPPTPENANPPSEAAADGTFWQVSATSNEESARALLRTLKDAGFPASLSPGPSNLTRVLVGPYTDTGTMGRAKTQLEAAGFHVVKH
jgi:cell division septation protein DedD